MGCAIAKSTVNSNYVAKLAKYGGRKVRVEAVIREKKERSVRGTSAEVFSAHYLFLKSLPDNLFPSALTWNDHKHNLIILRKLLDEMR